MKNKNTPFELFRELCALIASFTKMPTGKLCVFLEWEDARAAGVCACVCQHRRHGCNIRQ